MADFWQSYTQQRDRMIGWWNREDLVVYMTAPLDNPPDMEAPQKPETVDLKWLDPMYRIQQAEYEMAHTYYGADAFPIYEAHLGPGNLATFVGSEPKFAEETIWFDHCWNSPADGTAPLRFDPENKWFQAQMDILRIGQERAAGRYLVGMPDLVENVDIYASLRDSQAMLFDLIDNPDFVVEKVQEINTVWFEAYERYHDIIKDSYGGNAWTYFNIYAPGNMAKLQCDASAMFSPDMFKTFVVPGLTEQCEWLDYSMYHLDGMACMGHLDHLLDIDALTAIEWTPDPKVEPPGTAAWYDLYRRILDAGKAVHAWYVAPKDVLPLLDAVGGEGILLVVHAESEKQAHQIEDQIAQFRA